MSQLINSNDEESRDGYTTHNTENSEGTQQSRPSAGNGHTPRPRFTRSVRPAGSSENNYRPHYGGSGDGGYQSRGSWQDRSNGDSPRSGYQPRGAYQSRGDYQPRNGYQPRDYYQQRGEYRQGKSRYGQSEGGYQPRSERGGYQPRPRYNQDCGGYGQQGGYVSRDPQGGYQSRRSYQPRPDQQGGYGRPRYQGQGGFQPRPRPQGRGGYNPHAKYSQKKRLEYKEENYDPTVPVRLNKFLANAGVCSRRDADKYIEAGVVSVNGVVVTELGTKVLRTDEVKFHDNAVKMEKKVYVLLNKPKGYVTTSDDPQNRNTVMDLVRGACPERIYPVGRLDRNTTGVLLFTNDGELASKLTHPQFLKKKIYHVTTDQNVTAADIRRIAEGITLEDGEIKADAVEYASETDKKQVGIEIHSGKNRIVRRIFESMGYHVVKLDRVYFAGLTKKNVRRGDWRYLTEREVEMLRRGAFE